MLALLLSTVFASGCPQGPVTAAHAAGSATSHAEAVVVRGETELDPAAAFASARRKAEEHVRDCWLERASYALEQQRPFWLPDCLAKESVRRWLADLPIDSMVQVVDREDRERTHEFGNSYQTTLWVAEPVLSVRRGERDLKAQLRRLERTTAVKYGGVAAGWVVLALAIAWLDRLSRGYMTGRLRAIGLLAGIAMPTLAFLL